MKYIVLGDGGHSRVVREMITEKYHHKIIAVLDDKFKFIKKINKIIYGPIAYVKHLLTDDTRVIICIGNNKVRKMIENKLNIADWRYETVIHSSANISSSAFIGNGTVIMPGVFINAGVTVHKHCIINTGTIIEHDSNIESFAHLSPNTTLTGHVTIGEGAHVGASSTIIPGKHIGSWSTIGAGSTVIKNIPSQCTAVGCPTRIVRTKVNNNMEVRL